MQAVEEPSAGPAGMKRLIGLAFDLLRGQSSAAIMTRVAMMRALALVSNLLTGMLTAAMLGPDGRGEQAAMIVGPQFLAGLASLGLHSSLIYNIKRDPGHEREWFGAALVMTFFAAGALAGVGALLQPYWLEHYDPHVVRLAQWFLVLTPLSTASWSCLAAAEARGWFGFANRTLYLQSFGILLALLLLWRFGTVTPGRTAAIYVLSNVPVFLYFAIRMGSAIRPKLTLRRPFPRRLLHFGLRSYGVDLLGTLTGNIDQIVLVTLLPPALVGMYVVAQSIARILRMLEGAIVSVLFPSVAAQPVAVGIERVAVTLRFSIVAVSAVALAIGLLGPTLLHLVYGVRFVPAAAPLRVLLVDAVVISAAHIINQVYGGSGRPEVVILFEGAGIATALGGMVLLTPHFGIVGAAVAVLVGSCVRLVTTLAGLPLVLGVRVPRLFPLWSDLQMVTSRQKVERA